MTKKKTTPAKKTTQAPAVNLPAIFKTANSPVNADQAAAILGQFPPGNYTGAILANFRRGAPDIRSLLYYLAATYKPKAYLEIGVRLGYSMAMVAAASPKTTLLGVDMWLPNFGGEANGSPESVADQLLAMGCENPIGFLGGDSRMVLPKCLADNPGSTFDLILIDASSTTTAALFELRVCLRHLSPGGFLVFDDLNLPELRAAWDTIKAEQLGLEYYDEGIVGLVHKKG